MRRGPAIVVVGGSNPGSPAHPRARWRGPHHRPLQHPAPPSVLLMDGWRVSTSCFSHALHLPQKATAPTHLQQCALPPAPPADGGRISSSYSSSACGYPPQAGIEPATPRWLRVAFGCSATTLRRSKPLLHATVFTELTSNQHRYPLSLFLQLRGWAYGPLPTTLTVFSQSCCGVLFQRNVLLF